MHQHRYARFPVAASRGPGTRRAAPGPGPNEVTEIIPFDQFDEFDLLDEPDYVPAPQLDDVPDSDDLSPVDLPAPRRGGRHRREPTGPVRSRVLLTAVAAGAAAAAAHSATHHPATKSDVVLAAGTSVLGDGAGSTEPGGMQILAVKPAANAATHNRELAKGVAFAEERAQREARLQQPLFVMPAKGIFTSNFGYRWGVLHGGIDLANSIGTPILAVSDGVVIDAGPTAGYGMWVKLRHSDGTVTLYGHVNTTTVGVGERVMAGDQIATIGNRGDSTGPHLHFEVLLGGTNRIDPVPWLAKRGLSFGSFTG
ncbi:M23 family metallopeptidase [Mycobacterium sp.]|uniref:M23 family metallopeptidase n=1 Tax=Mycobacterium sp. TaxID=1785 RepID=UPI0031D106F4